jgi:hypothetical protein
MADWFRNTTWSDAIEAEFFRRLAHARSQRDQYIVIQAVMLARERPEVTLRLVDFYFDTRTNSFDDVRALWARAQAFAAMRDFPAAAAIYRAVLANERVRPSHKTSAYLDYPFMVAVERLESEYDRALSVLEERKADVAFPIGRFMWNAAYALILSDKGKSAEARPYAAAAVDAAQEQASEFRQHRQLGLVGPAHAPLIEQLAGLSRGPGSSQEEEDC